MHQCSFELNNRPLSKFKLGSIAVSAFSGQGPNINKRAAACFAGAGPIPPGTYYIIDRESGGVLGPLWDRIKGRTNWFALYAIDGNIDDATYCKEVERGNFRLHPKGVSGISKGCIVIERHADFNFLSTILRNGRPTQIVGTKHLAYGKVIVK
jgi:hypothetical protein